MTASECIDRIKSNFPSCPKNGNIEDMIANSLLLLKSWNLSGIQMEIFCNKILETYDHQHRYFPTEGELRSIYYNNDVNEKRSVSGFDKKEYICNTKHYSIVKIINILRGISKKILDNGGSSLTATDTAFWVCWSELLSIEGFLRDEKWSDIQIEKYLENVKASIVAGEQINFDVNKIKLKTELYDERKGNSNRVGAIKFFDVDREDEII